MVLLVTKLWCRRKERPGSTWGRTQIGSSLPQHPGLVRPLLGPFPTIPVQPLVPPPLRADGRFNRAVRRSQQIAVLCQAPGLADWSRTCPNTKPLPHWESWDGCSQLREEPPGPPPPPPQVISAPTWCLPGVATAASCYSYASKPFICIICWCQVTEATRLPQTSEDERQNQFNRAQTPPRPQTHRVLRFSASSPLLFVKNRS